MSWKNIFGLILGVIALGLGAIVVVHTVTTHPNVPGCPSELSGIFTHSLIDENSMKAKIAVENPFHLIKYDFEI